MLDLKLTDMRFMYLTEREGEQWYLYSNGILCV